MNRREVGRLVRAVRRRWSAGYPAKALPRGWRAAAVLAHQLAGGKAPPRALADTCAGVLAMVVSLRVDLTAPTSRRIAAEETSRLARGRR